MSSLPSDSKFKFSKVTKFFRENYNKPYRILEKIIAIYPITLLFPDKFYLEIMYRARTGRTLNLENPQLFSDKMQWLKLYDRKDWYWKIADKIEVRKYVAERIGEQYLIPVIATYNSVDEIEWEKLPKQFVLKCTHDSGTTVLCPDKSKLDIEESKWYLRKRMRKNFYYLYREWVYKDVPPRIICEKFMSPDGTSVPIDYKFLCFHGVPKLIQVDTERFIDHGRLTMYPDWTRAPFDIDRRYLKADLDVPKPEKLDEMLDICRKLSKDFKFIRVDLYTLNNQIYFGELTFIQGSGYDPIEPMDANYLIGSWLDLTKE